MTASDPDQSSLMSSGADRGIKLCLDCHKVCQAEDDRCPRCGSKVRLRKKDSLSRSWALTLTAGLLYIPANMLPIMTVSRFGRSKPDTIMSGVIELVHHGMAPIALLVFTASILVPLMKLLGMVWLLVCVHTRRMNPGRQTVLYRLIVWIGRWSMLDIFIISLLVALVQFGHLGTVTAGPAAFAFAAVVVLTMWAAMSFDPRLLWDRSRQFSLKGDQQ
ncbi:MULTISPECIES: paraquat-inducible protein A [unclassified Endozoicomonas]|uniref:paraquat-inducible protein A n=1 Tax=unclassified Endozoicomonas TaxID=2644528 RepID=UPI002148F656|nr:MULTISPECIES: paraquat-inducible protein A [unclassified Endozoicomonas]